MCGGGGLVELLVPLKKGGALNPEKPKLPTLKKPAMLEDAEAKLKAKKKTSASIAAAYGSADTVKTGGSGLGPAGAASKAYTTLLGT